MVRHHDQGRVVVELLHQQIHELVDLPIDVAQGPGHGLGRVGIVMGVCDVHLSPEHVAALVDAAEVEEEQAAALLV